MDSNWSCKLCGSGDLSLLLDLGAYELSTVYQPATSPQQREIPIKLSKCEECGLFQIPGDFQNSWVREVPSQGEFHEPEDHLDQVSSEVARFFPPHSSVRGFSKKDQSMLARLARFEFLVEIDTVLNSYETSCHSLSSATQQYLARHKESYRTAERESCRILVCRHALEHIDDLKKFLKKIASVEYDYIYLELPDAQNVLSGGKLWYLWEDHRSYFLDENLVAIASCANSEVIWKQKIERSSESLLCCLIKNSDMPAVPPLTRRSRSTGKIQNLVPILETWISANIQRRAVYFFGAGHLCSRMLHLVFSLKPALANDIFVVDGSTQKIGKRLPNTDLLIEPVGSILPNSVVVFVVNPEAYEAMHELKTRLNAQGSEVFQIDDLCAELHGKSYDRV